MECRWGREDGLRAAIVGSREVVGSTRESVTLVYSGGVRTPVAVEWPVGWPTTVALAVEWPAAGPRAVYSRGRGMAYTWSRALRKQGSASASKFLSDLLSGIAVITAPPTK